MSLLNLSRHSNSLWSHTHAQPILYVSDSLTQPFLPPSPQKIRNVLKSKYLIPHKPRKKWPDLFKITTTIISNDMKKNPRRKRETQSQSVHLQLESRF